MTETRNCILEYERSRRKLDSEYLRKRNHLEGKGEITDELFIQVMARESHWAGKISEGLDISPTKAVFAYYGIVYTIVLKEGMWRRGKNGGANSISLSGFCREMGLSENAHKTIGKRKWTADDGKEGKFVCYYSRNDDKRLRAFLSKISDDLSKSSRLYY